ncbi:cobalamin-dependent protein [uncultured Serinicoccus sp.]|uniref:cobalamin-dependent protein n=1 Tax=uncultured Serinicoccus sp. TaxID=735514 RepID=UPI00263763B3|nr:hypothetical protein [uncultured Serinicoccus sp.]
MDDRNRGELADKMAHRHTVLVASVGDDIHFIGLTLMTMSLKERGYLVQNLGIGNSLAEVFEAAVNHDVILISCNNGHASLHLQEFAQLKNSFENKYGDSRLWYLGGNLSTKDNEHTTIGRYRRYGFDFVAPRPIGLDTIHARLDADLLRRPVLQQAFPQTQRPRTTRPQDLVVASDDPLTDDEFERTRDRVLQTWPTGQQVLHVDPAEIPSDPTLNLSRLLHSSRFLAATPLLQPRTGVAHTDDEIAILTHLRENGSDIASVQLDAASRKNMYAQAQEGLRCSSPGGNSALNGYPIPIHGVGGIRKLVTSTGAPFQIRAGGPDHRLTYEIALAGGATSVEGGFLCYLLPYDATTSLTQSLQYWKYIDKLAGRLWQRHGVIVNREYFGPLTTTLIEPTVPICINLVQGILSAKSGVQCVSVGLAEQGNRAQDVAAMKVLARLMRRYLVRLGFGSVRVSTVFHQYMGAFPDERLARRLIHESAVTGFLAGATKIMTKTTVEATKIPTMSENAEGLNIARTGLARARATRIDRSLVRREYNLLMSQVQTVMNTIEVLGRGSFARGLISAVELGIIEVPFSPSQYSTHEQVTLRDLNGAVRFLRPNKLGFEPKVAEHHEQQLSSRMERDGTTSPTELLRIDLTQIPDGNYAAWPLS